MLLQSYVMMLFNMLSCCVLPPSDVVESVPSQTSLQERIRGGALRPMLELGVTPSHISMLLEEHEGEEVRGEDSVNM